MAESTITAKGQTTVRAEIRAPGASRARHASGLVGDAGCTIIVRAKTKSIRDMASMLKAPDGQRVDADDMNPWR